MKKFGLLIKLLIGIGAGMLIGSIGGIFGVSDSPVFIAVVRAFATFNSLFSTFLNFIIPLLILAFVSVGLADLGKKANKLFVITLLIAYGTTVTSGFIAYFIGKGVLPFVVNPITGNVLASNSFKSFFDIAVDPLFSVMTALILSFVLGLGMANSKGTTLRKFMGDLHDIITNVLNKIVIKLIPIHIAGLFCNIAAEGRLVATVTMFLSLYVIIIVLQLLYIVSQFALASLITRENCMKKMKNVTPAYFTALGTQSSASTIPVALNCAYKNNVKRDVADFTIPLCATINLNGDTICLVIGAMGILLAGGKSVDFSTFAPYILMLGVVMVAAPGVPGGGVMAALGLISSMLGFTATMQQLIIALHFSQDSFGTATNVTGDQAVALVVDKIDNKLHATDVQTAE